MQTPRTALRIEWPTVVLAVLLYLAFGLLTWFHADIPFLLLLLAGGYVTGLHGSLQHEVVHGHPTPSRRLNEALVFPSLWLWIPYPLYRALHLAHHRDDRLTCPVDDPESGYVTPEAWARMGRLRRGLRWALNTFAGRVLLAPARSWLWALRRLGHALRQGDGAELGMWVRHLPAMALPLVWAVWVCGMPLWTYLLCFAYAGTATSAMRSFLEHQARPEIGHRTVAIEAGPAMGLLFLYNNLHILHHQEPGLPWYRLPARWRKRRADLLALNGGYRFAGYWQVAWSYLLMPKEPPLHPGFVQAGTLEREPEAPLRPASQPAV